MDLTDIQLETGIDGLEELLTRDKPAPQFAMPANLFHFHAAKKKDAAARRGQ